VLVSHPGTRILKLAIGGLLLLFPPDMLLGRSGAKSTWGGLIADGTIGFGGGVLGGLAGLSGPLPTMWATIRGWGKHEGRAVFQAFNLTIALLSHAFAGLLTAEVGLTLLSALRGTITGAWLGVHAYGRLDDRRFRVIILLLLRVRRCNDLSERIAAPLRTRMPTEDTGSDQAGLLLVRRKFS
jgi:uncharacterized protein